MLDRLRTLFRAGGGNGGETARNKHDQNLAVAALLVEAARMDEEFGPEERETIARLMESQLGLTATEVREVTAEAESRLDDASDLWSFAQVVKNRFSEDERIELIEMLWDVVYADGELHHYEANLLRRIAGLIYVTDQESGAARKRVLQRRGIDPDATG